MRQYEQSRGMKLDNIVCSHFLEIDIFRFTRTKTNLIINALTVLRANRINLLHLQSKHGQTHLALRWCFLLQMAATSMKITYTHITKVEMEVVSLTRFCLPQESGIYLHSVFDTEGAMTRLRPPILPTIGPVMADHSCKWRNENTEGKHEVNLGIREDICDSLLR